MVERTFASILTVAKDEVAGKFSLERADFDFPEPVHAAAAKTEESVNEFIVQASASRAKALVEAG